MATFSSTRFTISASGLDEVGLLLHRVASPVGHSLSFAPLAPLSDPPSITVCFAENETPSVAFSRLENENDFDDALKLIVFLGTLLAVLALLG